MDNHADVGRIDVCSNSGGMRGRNISADGADGMLMQFRSEILGTPYVWSVSDYTIAQAVAAVERFGLRAADAVPVGDIA